MRGAWATIDLFATTEDKIKEALCAWFNNSTEAQERAGDIACATFEEHVRCHAVTDGDLMADVISLDVSTFYPVQDAFTLFYHYVKQESLLHVLGGLTYETLIMKQKGVVALSVLVNHQNRAFFPPYSSNMEALEGDHCFYWNHWFGEPVEVALLMGSTVSRDAFAEKMAWYRACDQHRGSSLPPLIFSCVVNGKAEHALTDKFTSMLAGLVSDSIEFRQYTVPNSPFDNRKFRIRFDRMRYDAERQVFMQRMKTLQTERSLIRLFYFNNLKSLLEQTSFVVDGTPLDHQVFYALYGAKALYAPGMFLNVPLEEVPEDKLIGLPIYPGGMIHLPFYWDTVASWIWNKYMCQMQQHFTLCRRFQVKDPVLDSMIMEEHRFMVKFLSTVKPLPPTRSSSSSGGGGSGRIVNVRDQGEVGADVADIEDFWELMPPCMARVRTAGRFPRNFERLRFVQVAWQAGISKGSIADPLRVLNDDHQRDTGSQRFENRFNMDAAISYITNLAKQRNGSPIHWCGNIISDTLEGKEGIHCPKVDEIQNKEGLSKEGLVVACKQSCCSSVRFSGPHTLIQHGLRQRQQLPPQQKEAIFQEEDDDVDEEEEEIQRQEREEMLLGQGSNEEEDAL